MTAARVLIIEGHPVLRGVIRMACDDSPALEVVGEVAEGQDALIAAAEVHPDVVVIDLTLQDMEWTEVVRELRALRPATRFLALTSKADDRALLATFRASLEGVIEKTAGVASIVEAVERVALGSRVVTAEHERRAMRELGRMVRGARESTQPTALLTEREIEVLQLLAEGMTLHQVARRLRISPRTVETHVRKTYRKLGVHNRVQALRQAASLGVVKVG
ncbi:MAG TPA: response regulator transcription factor [Acidimicrobiia bacterium]|nr:response regulator transcription factor [Acidimicrobiia bacterium]